MQIYLMRHASALTKAEDGNRPLSEQGLDEAPAIGTFLKEKSVPINKIFHSGVTRSEQTAANIAKVLSLSNLELMPSLDPDLPVEHLMRAIDHLETDCLLVGHLPNIEYIFNAYLAGSYYKSIVDFPPATLGCFKKEGKHWIMQWLVTPNLLLGKLK